MSPALYEQAPESSRVDATTSTVQWGAHEPNADPFIAGALWAGYGALSILVGSLLSDLAAEAQLLERWVPSTSSWVLVA